MKTNGKFYLGRVVHTKSGETTKKPLLFDPDDLTTHAVAVGMTGSGKTGLCIDILEEAALNGIPALMVDPKGDMTNTLLHFPNLVPDDFKPWVNADQAKREGKSTQEMAKEAAALWRDGLTEWDINQERIRALKESADFAVYTPGSNAGIPVNILASLKAPLIDWTENREILRSRITGTATALLGLVGLDDIDPVRSREHILLANIFENAWSKGQDLDLGELIMQIQSPPFTKLGVFDVNTFFPEKERFELAMLLNNILAAPSFQPWITGQPLDISNLLFSSDGRPRHSVFYIAHLSDAERMFFVTLLYTSVETWMRSQAGTSSLRAIVYFDEIFGYLPPVSNPPSKEPMLRLLKQARAFGVAQILVTQNPVDIDYKALSNAGTWFIGKLQTDQDKQRLLDGLESAMDGGMQRSEYDRLISNLGKRVFLLHNVHEEHPQLFKTRWAMNYLAGPLTRLQIPALNTLAGASKEEILSADPAPDQGVGEAHIEEQAPQDERPAKPTKLSSDKLELGTKTRPAVPGKVNEYFLPNNFTLSQSAKASEHSFPTKLSPSGLLYRPILLAQSDTQFFKRKYNLDHVLRKTALVSEPDARGFIRWDQYISADIDFKNLDDQPVPDTQFTSLDPPLNDAKTLSRLEADFKDWIYHSVEVTVRANEALEVYAGPEIAHAAFLKMCSEAAHKEREDEIEDIEDRFEKKIDKWMKKLSREKRELSEDKAEASQRKMEEIGTHVENVISLFTGRRRSRRLSTSLRKRRLSKQSQADVEESLDSIDEYKKEISELEQDMKQALAEIEQKWSDIVSDITEIPVAPYKKDIQITIFGVAWMPHYVVRLDEKIIELPGFNQE